ncbi:MAG: DNA-processing protein DprA, partial [Promethearchaeota archaeon]
FAKGIDIEAFIGAKELNGRYIGVLASGVENVYPNENKQYIQAVIKNGALISQNFIWNRVNRTALQLRNRFSAQLSLGSIFIEGNYRSGTIWQYKFVRDGGGIEIKNDLSNIDKIIDILEEEYLSRLEFFNDKAH